MKIVPFLLLLLGTAGAFAQAYDPYRRFAVKELQEDFRFVRSTMEKKHPRPYEFTPKRRFNQLLDSLYKRIDHEMTEREFQYFMLPVIANIHCSHTKLLSSDSLNANFNKYFSKPPFKLLFKDQQAFFALGEGIEKGTEVLSINGVSTKDFIASYKARMYNEGRNLTWIYNRMNAGVTGLFPGLCDTPGIAKYQLGIGEQVVTLDGIPADTYDSLNSDVFSKEYKMLVSRKENRAVLTIRSFNLDDLNKYEQVIRASFAILQSEGIQNLIIDVRGNIGGKTEAVALLLQHLMPKPFVYFRSGAGFEEYKKPIPPAANRFTGRVLVLADGGCRSSTGFFLAFVKTHKLGEIIGEESCATWSCNNNGQHFVLPNTKLIFNCSTGIYETTCTGLPHGRGVMPDHEVKPDVPDLISGKDTVMNFAIGLIH